MVESYTLQSEMPNGRQKYINMYVNPTGMRNAESNIKALPQDIHIHTYMYMYIVIIMQYIHIVHIIITQTCVFTFIFKKGELLPPP